MKHRLISLFFVVVLGLSVLNILFFPSTTYAQNCTITRGSQHTPIPGCSTVYRYANHGKTIIMPGTFQQAVATPSNQCVKYVVSGITTHVGFSPLSLLTTSISVPGNKNGQCDSSHGFLSNKGLPNTPITIHKYIPPPGVSSSSSLSSSSSSSSSNKIPTLSCPIWGNGLNWLLCPVVSGLMVVVNAVNNLINSLLLLGVPPGSSTAVTPVLIFGPLTATNATPSQITAQKGYEQAWSSFKNLALGLLVIIGLIIVISQATGFEMFDAYTIRKAMPRLVIAAIALTLSWQIMDFLIMASNELGLVTKDLILGPFSGLSDSINLNGTGAVAVNLFAGGAALALGIMGLLSFVATGAIALFVALIVLILRQILIILLIIIAPIAIVAGILPNTQKAYKIWWESFSKALLMFPIIVAFLNVGRAFSAVAAANPSAADQLIAIIAYFLPYFLLPLTFRFAGSALSSIGGAVHSKHQGAFQRLTKFRQTQPTRRYQKAKEGQLYKGANPVSSSMRKAAQFAAFAPSSGFKKSKIQSAVTAQNMHNAQKLLKEDPTFDAIKGDDTLLGAFLNGGSEKEIKNYLAKNGNYTNEGDLAVATANVVKARHSAPGTAGMMAAVIAQAGTGTGFKDSGDMMEAINKVANGDTSLRASLFAVSKSQATQAGRIDQGGSSFGDGMAIMADLDAGKITKTEARQRFTDSVIKSAPPGQHAYGKSGSVKELSEGWSRHITKLNNNLSMATTPDEKAKAERSLAQGLATVSAIHTAMSSVAPQNAQMFADEVLNKKISVTALPNSIRNATMATTGSDGSSAATLIKPEASIHDVIIGHRNSSADFAEMERSYGNSATAAAMNAAQQQAFNPNAGPQQPVNPNAGPNFNNLP